MASSENSHLKVVSGKVGCVKERERGEREV
jgi:hypothetical protein